MNTTQTDTGNSTPRYRHGHLNDLGFSALASYFFCMLASVFAYSGAYSIGSLGNGVLIILLVFLGSISLTLLFLAMIESRFFRNGGYRLFSLASAILLAAGPAVFVLENRSDTFAFPISLVAFALSGCGYSMCLVIWGRILSTKDAERSLRQIIADMCMVIIVVIAVFAMPSFISTVLIAALGCTAGVVGAFEVAAADDRDVCGKQVVVSDTRETIPRMTYLVAGTLWMAYGAAFALLSNIHLFSDNRGVAEVVVFLVAAFAGLAIVRLHRGSDIDSTKLFWTAGPLLVTGIAFFISAEPQLLRLAVIMMVFSILLSYLHLSSHFAALAHRPDLLPNQMFSWGWLAPYTGMFLGLFVGMTCLLVGGLSGVLFLSLSVGALLITVMFLMRSIGKINLRHQRQKAEAEKADEATAASRGNEARRDETFSRIALSGREKDVAILLLQGRSQAVIAEQLFVAESTVNTHVKHIYQKANVRSKQEFIDLFQ